MRLVGLNEEKRKGALQFKATLCFASFQPVLGREINMVCKHSDSLTADVKKRHHCRVQTFRSKFQAVLVICCRKITREPFMGASIHGKCWRIALEMVVIGETHGRTQGGTQMVAQEGDDQDVQHRLPMALDSSERCRGILQDLMGSLPSSASEVT